MSLIDRTRRFYPSETLLETYRHVPTGGKRNPCWLPDQQPRFALYVREHDEHEEAGWRYKLTLVDLCWLDDDGYPIHAVAHGDSWAEAYDCAAEFISQALASPTCIFY